MPIAAAALLSPQAQEANILRVPFVLASAGRFLGYEESLNSQLQETEFGYRKRCGDQAVRESGLLHTIVHAPAIDERLEEGLELQVETERVGWPDDE